MKNKTACFSHESDNWRTPKEFFSDLNHIYHFDIDLCSNGKDNLCPNYFTKDNIEESLKLKDKCIFCNPPYSKVSYFVSLCHTLSLNGNFVIMLIPARTDTKWFHKYIYSYNLASYYFIKGRLKFLDEEGNPRKSAPFPSMVVCFHTERSSYNGK